MKFCNDKSKNNKQHLDILSKNGSKTKIGQIYSINRILSRRLFWRYNNKKEDNEANNEKVSDNRYVYRRNNL